MNREFPSTIIDMKQVLLEDITAPDKRSNRSQDKFYQVNFGAGKYAFFTGRTKAVAANHEVSKMLTDRLFTINEIYCRTFELSRQLWLYSDHRAIKFNELRQNLIFADEFLDKATSTTRNFNVMMNFKQALNYLIKGLHHMCDFFKGRNQYDRAHFCRAKIDEINNIWSLVEYFIDRLCFGTVVQDKQLIEKFTFRHRTVQAAKLLAKENPLDSAESNGLII
jgi:hypothetical protein